MNVRGARDELAGFTLFEVLVALAVFMLAFGGLALALDAALGGSIEAREARRLRHELENRLALCLVDRPEPGSPRITEAAENRGIAVREELVPWEIQNAEGKNLTGLYLLKIEISHNTRKESLETALYLP